MLQCELWFTENDYRPANLASNSQPGSPSLSPSAQQTNSSENFTSLLMSMTSANNPAQMNSNVGSNSNMNSTNASNGGSTTNTSNNNSVLQQLCVRSFKIKFDPRQGIHLQIPVIFDYFHLSAVMLTMHCTLLTLLPPVMLGYISYLTIYMIFLYVYILTYFSFCGLTFFNFNFFLNFLFLKQQFST